MHSALQASANQILPLSVHQLKRGLRCSMFTPDVGGVMNKIVHFYAWEDLDQRDQVRKTLGATEQWKQFLKDSRPQVMGPQESKIMKEALGVYDVLGMPRTADYCSPPLAGSGKVSRPRGKPCRPQNTCFGFGRADAHLYLRLAILPQVGYPLPRSRWSFKIECGCYVAVAAISRCCRI